MAVPGRERRIRRERRKQPFLWAIKQYRKIRPIGSLSIWRARRCDEMSQPSPKNRAGRDQTCHCRKGAPADGFLLGPSNSEKSPINVKRIDRSRGHARERVREDYLYQFPPFMPPFLLPSVSYNRTRDRRRLRRGSRAAAVAFRLSCDQSTDICFVRCPKR